MSCRRDEVLYAPFDRRAGRELFTMALIWIYLKPARLPLLTYFIAYTTTTVVGAAALLDDTGLREFKNSPANVGPKTIHSSALRLTGSCCLRPRCCSCWRGAGTSWR